MEEFMEIFDLGKFKNNIALEDSSGRKVTYSELLRESDNIIDRLGSRKLIFIKATNSIDAIIMYIASVRGGHASLLLDPNLSDSLLETLSVKYRPHILWDGSIKVINSSADTMLHEDITVLLSTSGSTGSPKLVKLSNKNIQSNANSISEYLQLDQTERAITSLPMSYSYGLSVINSHLIVGARLLVTPLSITQSDFWDFFKSSKATSIAGVPYTYEMLDRIKFGKMDLPSLRYMTQAGGKLNKEAVSKFYKLSLEKGIKFITMYGQTEATARISYLPSEKVNLKVGCIGIPIPNGYMEIVDLEGKKIVTPNTEGELVYHGDNVMMGYANDREGLMVGDELHGSLKTGDIAKYDEDGYFYITGRLKRFIKVFGNRINLEELERVLSEYDCICVGVDDLIIVTMSVPDESIKYKIREMYGIHPSAIKIKAVTEYPRSSSGKIQYGKLLNNIIGEES